MADEISTLFDFLMGKEDKSNKNIQKNQILEGKYQYPVKVSSKGEVLHGEEPTNIGGYLPKFKNLNPKHPSGHRGLDLQTPRNTPIYAIGPGKVLEVRDYPKGGHTIKTSHEDGKLTAYYAHMEKPSTLAAGQEIDSNTVVGFVGTSGNAFDTAPHVHFETKINGSYVDPKSVIGKPFGFLAKVASLEEHPSYVKVAAEILKLRKQ